MKKKFYKTYEFFLLILLVVFAVVIGLINPAFFSVGTLFDVIRIQTVYVLMAFGLLPVIILGGVDISFVAIAALATYPVHIISFKIGLRRWDMDLLYFRHTHRHFSGSPYRLFNRNI